jgi:hypothetical protein
MTLETTHSGGDRGGAAEKQCSGPCGRRLPLSSFGVNASRRDGRRSECKECRGALRAPQGREAHRARALERELLSLLGTYSTTPLSDVLSRALDEVRQIGASGARFDEQVSIVRQAVIVNGCRTSAEIVEEKGLSRWVVERALEKLVAAKVVEPRDSYRLSDEAEEAGRPVTEYHPKNYPRGEGFSPLFRHSRAVEDDLL